MKSTVIYKRGNGYSIHADFYGVENNFAPVILYIHGGGLVWGSRKDINPDQVKLYTTAGFAVFSIDYRLAPETKMNEILEDVEDAFSWLKENGEHKLNIDPDKIFITGGSAGGYLALMTGTFKQKPRAIISFYGYGDITSSWATLPSSHFLGMPRVTKELARQLVSNLPISEAPLEKRYGIYLYGRQTGNWIEDISGLDTFLNKKQLRQWCPLFNISSEYPPTLLLHGTNDVDVPFEESKKMSLELSGSGVYNKLITMNGYGHVFDQNMNNPDVKYAFSETLQFLNRFVM